MEHFDVRTHSIDVLEESEFVRELQSESGEHIVLVTQGLAHQFGDIGGGSLSTERADILELTEPEGNVPDNGAAIYELHFDNSSYALYVNNTYVVSRGDEDTLLLKVVDYNRYEHGFAREMTEDIDGRETRYE
jgi:hypothetical protein